MLIFFNFFYLLLNLTKHDISNVLNSYFVNIGKRISESMNAGPWDHNQYLKGNYVNSLFFAPVSSADVEEIILSLRNKPGNSNAISTSVLKRIRRHVSHVLCHIINLSLRTGIFPDCLKLARVTPIPKGGDSTNAGESHAIHVRQHRLRQLCYISILRF